MIQLVKKAQKGDQEAFIQLIERNKQAMYKVAIGILNNDTDAADALQDTILSCYENLRTLRQPKYFKTWMTRILINHCTRILKEHQKLIPIDSYVSKSSNCNSKELSCQESTSWTDNQDFFELLNQMDETYRLVLLLYYVEEFNIKEISHLLDMNENTAKSRLSRGRGLFRKIYLKKYPTYQYETKEVM